MEKIKYILLPPQPAPKQLTAHRNAGNLGEHKRAFMNANNPHGFPEEAVPEEPVSEELAALFTTTLTNAPKISKAERKRGLVDWYYKLIMAGYVKKEGVWVKRDSLPAEPETLTPLQAYEKARNDPRWQQPWNHAAYHEGIQKHIYATRTHFSYRAELGPLRGDEYRSRLDKLLDQLEQQSNIQNPALRKLVVLEKAEQILAEQASQFTLTIHIDEFMSPIEPKSDPTGRHRGTHERDSRQR